MAFNSSRNYNNNNQRPTSTTFTPISFANPESKLEQTRLSISYFNRLMAVSIAKKLPGNNSDQFASYDNDNAVVVYVSFSKAKILHNLIMKMLADKTIYNVCIELKNGLLKISDGVEYGSTSPCISISSADANGNVTEVVYQTKAGFYSGAYNYSDGKYSAEIYDDMELTTFAMVLEQYYIASSYAVAATVMEASMYKREGMYNMIKSIAEKVGASTPREGGNSGGGYNSRTTFLAGGNNVNNSSNSGMSGAASSYETASFDDIANSMNAPED